MAGTKTLATNRKARHEYFIEETYECGIELKGTEVKSIRQGKVNLTDGYASVDNSEVFIKQVHIIRILWCRYLHKTYPWIEQSKNRRRCINGGQQHF